MINKTFPRSDNTRTHNPDLGGNTSLVLTALFCSQDNFGYGESVLSMVFALNGVAVGVLQLLGMRHLVRLLGKHMMLITGNMCLAAGMVGVAFCRHPVVHFAVRENSREKPIVSCNRTTHPRHSLSVPFPYLSIPFPLPLS